jgi:outer membrane receptor protein involved in Fe transport
MRTRILLALLLAPALIAQTTDTASIRGTVADAAGARVAAAAVALENIAAGTHRETTTNERGEYTFGAVPVTGNYRLRITKNGFADVTRGPFALRAGETATFDATLDAGAINESVTVFGTAEGVRSDSPELGTRLDEKALETIPVFGRKITSLVLLNSAVRPARGVGDLFLNNTLFVVNGGGRRQTTWALDGSSGDDAWGRQTIFTNVPLTTIREFTVLTNAFSAEYGRTTGSAVNVITQAGTNEMRGDFSATYRPRSLQANAPVTGVKAGDELKQFSAMLSGPVVADRTHFLIGVERNDQQRESRITSALAPGFFTGDFDQTLALARIDHELGASNHLLLRANVDRLRDTNPADAVGGLNLPSAARTFRRATSSLQLSDAAVISATMFNEARAIAMNGSPITEFTPANPSPQFVRPGVATEGDSRSARLTNRQYQLADTFTTVRGKHAIRAGGDVLHSRSGGNGQEFGSPFVLGQFTFNAGIPATTPTSSLTINDVARFTQGFGNVSYRVSDNLYALFVQDDWHPLDRLTVNLGLRYDSQQLTGDDNNLAPRLGFAWNAGNDGRTVVRGGYGVFYSQVQSNIVASWELGGPTGFFNFSVAPRQPGFPTSLAPIAAFPPGTNLPARDVTIRPGRASLYNAFFDTSKLRFYPSELRNPRTQEATLGFEREVARQWFVSADAVYTHTRDILWNLDANAPSSFPRLTPGLTRPAATADATRPIVPVPNGYRRILVTTNNGEAKYRGLQLNARKTFEERFGLLASYTYSRSRNNIEADSPGGDPNDVNAFRAEWADSQLSMKHRGVVTLWHRAPFGVTVGGVATAASGRPFNITTGADNNGDAANTDRPVVGGQVIGRNAGRGSSTFNLDAFLEKDFGLARGTRIALRAEAFNLTNRTNVVGRNGVFGNDAAGVALPTFGVAVGGINNVEPGREYQFALRVRY